MVCFRNICKIIWNTSVLIVKKRCPQQKVKTIKAFCDDSSIVLQMNFSENATITARFSLLYNTVNFGLENSYLKKKNHLYCLRCNVVIYFFQKFMCFVMCNPCHTIFNTGTRLSLQEHS